MANFYTAAHFTEYIFPDKSANLNVKSVNISEASSLQTFKYFFIILKLSLVPTHTRNWITHNDRVWIFLMGPLDADSSLTIHLF